jgi:hypothetical protein
MWVFTREGFFSVVWDKDCRGDELVVRSQCKEDICRLAKKLSGYCDENQIVPKEGRGYRYRIRIAKQAWSAYLADSALQVDYPSVKKNVVPADDALRRDAYYQVWEALYRWREKIDAHEKERPGREKSAGIRLPVRWKP